MNIYKGIDKLPTFKNTVITIGSFDGVHRGHQKLIGQINDLAREIEGESLIITFDPHPRKIIFPKDKSLKLITSLDEKLALFEKYGVDNVVVVPFSIEFSQQSPQEYVEAFLLELFNPKYLVIGYDHHFGLNRQGDIHFLKKYETTHNLEVVEVQKEELEEIAISSTKIRNALNEGNVLEANRFLAHTYALDGKVVRGDQIGNTIGFPTANIQVLDDDKIIPAYGIYAVEVDVDSVRYGGMLYIGARPSINNKNVGVIEVNIFDFDQDIYGETIRVHFVDYLRGDKKFDGLEALKRQLFLDKEAALERLKRYKLEDNPTVCTLAVLNYNGVHHLESYLPTFLEACTYPHEILVIDNASNDDSIAYLQEWHPEVKIRGLKKNYGFAGGYNKGLQEINSKYTLIVNSDIILNKDCLDPLIHCMEMDPSIGIVQPKIRSIEDKAYFEYAGAAGGWIDLLGYPFCRGRVFDTIEEDQGQYDDPIEIAWASGACMLIRSDLFHQLGGFDADYFAHQEEIDLCYRVRKAGYRILCLPEATVYHLGGGTLSYESPFKTFLNFRNNINTLIKNEGLLKLVFLLPVRLALDIIAGLKFVAGGKWKNALSILKAYGAIFSSIPKTIGKKSDYHYKIKAATIGKPNRSGLYPKSILLQYYLLGRKKFSDFIH